MVAVAGARRFLPTAGILLLTFGLICALAACQRRPAVAPPPPASPLTLTRASFADLPGWSEDPIAEALPALKLSCARLAQLADKAPVGANGIGGRAGDWRAACTRLLAANDGDGTTLRSLIEGEFSPVKVSAGGEAEGLFTGYYEPELDGARISSARFPVPLYRRPPDLISINLGLFSDDLVGRTLYGQVEGDRLVPYASRAEIDGGALAGRGLELLWVADPVDAYLLQIQGSGRVRLTEGGMVRVGFAGSNGQPFLGIGRTLIDRGLIDPGKSSMQEIRAWLKAHPAEAAAIMRMNRRFIFFREIDGDGPIGAEGVVLTPGRSLAVDTGLLPLGAPLWLDTTWPGLPERPLRRLMVAQDAGAAIKGAVRGDLFWGTGEAALDQAGRMKSPGRYWLLLPKPVAQRIAGTN